MNKVVDYMTPKEVCKAIGISENSTPLITRFINDGRIKGYKRFGTNLAIPVSWVKSECNLRGIEFNGIELEEEDIPVSLDDYIPLTEWVKKQGEGYTKIFSRIKRGKFDGNYVRFGNTYWIREDK